MFNLEHPNQKKIHDIWAGEAPLKREMTEGVRAHLQKVASVVPLPFSPDYFPWSGTFEYRKTSNLAGGRLGDMFPCLRQLNSGNIDYMIQSQNFDLPIVEDDPTSANFMGTIFKRLENGNIEMVDKDATLVRLPEDLPLQQISKPEAYMYLGAPMHVMGTKNGAGGLQGYGCLISDDGFTMHEGFFVDNVREGRQRSIKLSKRRPGCATIREGIFSDGNLVGEVKQVKYDAEGGRTEDSFEVEHGSFKDVQSKPETRKQNGTEGEIDWLPKIA